MSAEITQWVDPDGVITTLDVDWEANGRFMPAIQHQDIIVPGKPGGVHLAARHANHEFTLKLTLAAADEPSLRLMQRSLVRAMDPARGPGIIRVSSVIGDVREIPCYYVSGLEMDESPGNSGPNMQQASVVFRAYDPYWRDTSDTSLTYGTSTSVTTYGPNLNANPYFETDASNWTPSLATFVRTTAKAHQGAASGLLTPNGSGSTAYVQSEQAAVTAGGNYRVSAWVLCGTSRLVTLNVNWFDSTGAYLSTSSTGDSPVTLNVWTYLQGILSAPVGAAFGTVVPTLYSPATASDVLYIDEAALCTATTTIVTSIPTFFPIFPIRLTTSQIAVDATVSNTGDVEAWPVFTIQGPGSQITLQNLTTGKFTTFNTLQLTTGQIVVIDTRPGAKTVTLNYSNDMFSDLSDFSALWPLAVGNNAVRLTMSGAVNGASQLTMNFRKKYLSP